MGSTSNDKGRRLPVRRRGIAVESLERRALLTTVTETFVAPSLTSLINQAEKGKNTTPAQIKLMVGALQSQLKTGPLADYNSGAVNGNGFITESQSLEASFEANVETQLGTKFPNNQELIVLQGQRVVANLISENQQATVGLIPTSSLSGQFLTTINSLTAGPILAIGTKTSAITGVTQTLETQLATLEKDLASGALTLAKVDTTLTAETEAYRTDIHAGIQMTQLRISGQADTDINALELTANNLSQTNPSNAGSQLSSAITAFDNQVLDKTGLFAPKGALSKSRPAKLHTGQTNGQALSQFNSVSGLSTVNGVATLTTSLTSSDGSPLMGKSVDLTVNGAFVGVGITNFTGVATVIAPVPSPTIGTEAGAIVAYFASDTNYLTTSRSGDLVVIGSQSVLGQVTGSAVYGTNATLSATLTNPSGVALAGKAVTFSYNGTAVGTAITNGNGVATLSGVPTNQFVGTTTGSLIASFAGDPGYGSSANTGNLIVTQASSALARPRSPDVIASPWTARRNGPSISTTIGRTASASSSEGTGQTPGSSGTGSGSLPAGCSGVTEPCASTTSSSSSGSWLASTTAPSSSVASSARSRKRAAPSSKRGWPSPSTTVTVPLASRTMRAVASGESPRKSTAMPRRGASVSSAAHRPSDSAGTRSRSTTRSGSGFSGLS